MNQLNSIVDNYYLVSAFIAWFSAQLIKFLAHIFVHKKIDFRKLTSSGGMPSSHSSAVCGLAASVAFVYGFDSVSFAICFVFGIVVMYDAAGVRRETGKQARILNRMISDIMNKKPVYFPKELKELVGHTPLEVLMGGLLGVAIAAAMYFVYR